MIRKLILRWVEGVMARRPPDFVVRAHGAPYMERWWAVPRNRFFNIYLHRFVHDDEDRALHDHPWVSLTYALRGGYFEIMKNRTVERREGAVIFRLPTTAHRVVLRRNAVGEPVQAISLFLTGPTVRTWGFHCEKGWVPWQRFVDARDSGSTGAGCP